jgi:hypothetical protein
VNVVSMQSEEASVENRSSWVPNVVHVLCRIYCA